ncbi:unnamed protein product [Bursaphelenchus okinawaensis]|uniref:Uncharacterized protein n=1 Tax=Bursaphelenchus okinawaensis TaxID=465554 RepID=A0A811LEE7_9BILA|nr:unnamed protein product [Bursaphelenchus okinawaensis]CAG9121046.1 unnamed protein product [Bursaphelenchus okinawaensis]
MSVISTVSALSCLSNDNGYLEVIEDPEYKYCITIPPVMGKDGKMTEPSQYGLTAEMDDTEIYDELFASSTLISMCIQEKYDFAAIVKQSYGPKFTHKLPDPEYMTRCLCRSNYCNRGATIDEFYAEQLKIFV